MKFIVGDTTRAPQG